MPIPPRIDPIIQAVARKAETIYTKMALQRDESQDLTRRKKDDGDTKNSSLQWEDTTDVSVLALRGFLEDLLGLAHTIPQINTDTLPLPSVPDDVQPAAPQTAASYAAQAYRTTGLIVHDENVDLPPPVIPVTISDEEVRLGNDFGEAERETMRGFLSDLRDLERRGVGYLTLRRSLTFLESIALAIEDAK